MNRLILILGIVFTSIAGNARQTVELFMPHAISTQYSNRDLTISPDGNEIYYTIQGNKRNFSIILFIQKNVSEWSEPKIAPFSGRHGDLEPMFSPDGNRLYFASNRPLANESEKTDYDIWYVDRIAEGWSEPINPGSPVNTDKNEFYPSVTSDGSIYFTASYDDSKGTEDLYVCEKRGDVYADPVNLGDAINSKTYEFNSFVAPDGNYIIFSSFGRADGLGGGDLYISFKENSEWMPAKPFVSPINSDALDYCPFVHKGTFYFTSNRSKLKNSFSSYQEIIDSFSQVENGLDNVYSVRFENIKQLVKD